MPSSIGSPPFPMTIAQVENTSRPRLPATSPASVACHVPSSVKSAKSGVEVLLRQTGKSLQDDRGDPTDWAR